MGREERVRGLRVPDATTAAGDAAGGRAGLQEVQHHRLRGCWEVSARVACKYFFTKFVPSEV